MENICVSCGAGCPQGRRPTLSLHLGTRRERLLLCKDCDGNRGSLNDQHVASILKARNWNQADIDTATAHIRTIVRKILENGQIRIIRAA